MTPETARLFQHWRQRFSGIRPFFCQVEAVETAIWLTEVVPRTGRVGKGFLDYLANSRLLQGAPLGNTDFLEQSHGNESEI